ncbi:hypothetical protein [Bacteroides intestinalis]|uniref:DUF695 domain-containing protein n=1 Tax=Bacteroides intestinalis TaxID=329854 RepID=A0A4Q5HG88_9BACE|nr:hypothetical protein [Bacteroides intestinalis]KAA4693090.1 hypothetical protein F3B37_07620 [Bacteroides intestinalis]KAA4720175.1 hypothetical protein F3B35_10670 [Bacteroides intestinalis]RYT81586.1 hypothetical protein EAJ06_05905 [Bacteroides intestinalis]
MDKTLKEKIDAWTDTDEHTEIPFRKRVQDFWKWFTDNEKKLSQIVENRGKSDSENAVEFIAAGTNLINEEVHFNLGGDYEFTFSVEGHSSLFYLYPYVVSQLPEQFKDKWHFFPFNQGTDSSFSFGMYGVNVAMDQVQVAVTYQEDINAFSIRFYEKDLCSLEEAQSYNAYYIMMEIMLGEGLSYQYIADVERADAPLEDAISLPALRTYIVDTLKAHDKEVFDNPQQVYTSYRFEPQENEELRFDVVAGSSCFQPLVANYYNGSTELFDQLNRFGAQAMFIAFPFENEKEGDAKKALDFRYELEDRLSEELLSPEGLGLLLGGAVGTGTCYIDLLLFDKPAFMEKIIPFLKDYPQYRFYLSDFRQDCDLHRLFETEDDESED